jgi:hypothetical protein
MHKRTSSASIDLFERDEWPLDAWLSCEYDRCFFCNTSCVGSIEAFEAQQDVFSIFSVLQQLELLVETFGSIHDLDIVEVQQPEERCCSSLKALLQQPEDCEPHDEGLEASNSSF